MNARILIVDDTEAVLESLEEYLLMEGYEVVTAQNGLQALEMVLAQTPDLIITDLLMPEMDGLELIQALRKKKETTATPILVFSARPLEPGKVASDLGANAFLLKPSAVETISDAVASLLKGTR